MRDTVNETMGSLLVKTLIVRGGTPMLDMTRKQLRFLRRFESYQHSIFSVNGVMVAHLGWTRRFQTIVQLGRFDGVVIRWWFDSILADIEPISP